MAPARKSTLAAMEMQVEAFNERHPVGQRVAVILDNRERKYTTTRSPASVLSGHSAVVWLDGMSGCYMLDRVIPLDDGPPAPKPRLEAYSPDEMRAAFAKGDTVQQIYARARRIDRAVTKDVVRAILFAEPTT